MKFVFDFELLQDIMQDFYKLLNIRLSVFDADKIEIFPYPPQLPRFCQYIRHTKIGEQNCRNCDLKAMSIADNMRSPYLYTCHAGLTEAVMALRLDDKIFGYIFLSHMLPNDVDSQMVEHILKQNLSCGIPEKELRDAIASVSVRTTEQILAAVHILEALVSYIYFKDIVKEQEMDLAYQIQRYIKVHISEELNSQRICEEFSYSRTKIYKTFFESFGMGVAEYIQVQRISKAKKMLLEGHTVSEVVEACGYSNCNYFFKVFRKSCGLTPRQFQKNGMQ